MAAWFPTAERGTASAIFNSAQYFATAMFAPLTGWITYRFGWPYVFFVMGAIGVVIALVWVVDHLQSEGSSADRRRRSSPTSSTAADWSTWTGTRKRGWRRAGPKRSYLGQLLGNRMLLGVYIGQYCITTITYFFLTWFPVYLVEQRGMSILKAGCRRRCRRSAAFSAACSAAFLPIALLKRAIR